jgi:hypothetical protein
VSIYNSEFKSDGAGSGISGNGVGSTLGGVFYVGSSNYVDIDNSTFQQISSIGSGGGLYVNSSTFTDIKNSLFNEIVVSISGGMFYFINTYIYFYKYYSFHHFKYCRRYLLRCISCIQH